MSTQQTGIVYLIHLEKPYKGCSHYIGFTLNVEARLLQHKQGTGSKFLRAVNRAGITYSITNTWEGVTREFERKLKNRKNSKCLCPVCKGKKPLTFSNPQIKNLLAA